jgi:protein-disulfide isomerase
VFAALDQVSGINSTAIIACSQSTAADALLKSQMQQIKEMNIEGTPTIFVNDQVFIGPKPLRVYERQLSTTIDWLGISLISIGALIIIILLYFIIFRRD